MELIGEDSIVAEYFTINFLQCKLLPHAVYTI